MRYASTRGVRFNDNLSKVKSKEELLEMLKRYKRILNHSMEEYLNSLIELEFSVVKDYIDIRDRMCLAELKIYQDVAIYNIYKRALDLFNKVELPLKISEGLACLEVSTQIDNRNIDLYTFLYTVDKLRLNYETRKIGNIILYRAVEKESDNRDGLTSEEEKEIELTNRINELLLEDYGLTADDFTAMKPSYGPVLPKAFVKRQPQLTITNEIKYI